MPASDDDLESPDPDTLLPSGVASDADSGTDDEYEDLPDQTSNELPIPDAQVAERSTLPFARSPQSAGLAARLNTAASAGYRRRRRRIGNLFPIDLFVDHERTQKLLNGIAAAAPGSGFACIARFWQEPRGTYFESLECLVKCTNLPQMWMPCEVIAYDDCSRRFLVKWLPPSGSAASAALERASSPLVFAKLISEILLPGESLDSLRWQLELARVIREEFEFNLAVSECVKIIRPVVESSLPSFPKRDIERVFAQTRSAVLRIPAPLQIGSDRATKSLPRRRSSHAARSLRAVRRRPRTLIGGEDEDEDDDFTGDFEDEEKQMRLLLEQEVFTSQLLPIYAELRDDFVVSELKSLLINNQNFRSFVPTLPQSPQTWEVYSRVSAILSAVREGHQDGGHVQAILLAHDIEPHLNFATSLAVRDVLSSLRGAIADLFSVPLLDTMKTHVSRVHPSKRRLLIPELMQSTASGRDDAAPASEPTQLQPQQPIAVPPSHGMHGKHRRHRHKHRRHHHGHKATGGTSASAVAAAQTIQMHGANHGVGSGGALAPAPFTSEPKSAEIVPIMESPDGVTFGPADFLDMCEWLQIDFDVLLRDRLPMLVHAAFRQLLGLFGIREPDGPVPLNLTLTQRSARAFEADPATLEEMTLAIPNAPLPARHQPCSDMFVRLGRMVTVMADTFASPLVSSCVTETYRAIEHGALHVLLQVNIRSIEPSRSAGGDACGSKGSGAHAAQDGSSSGYTLEYDVPLSDLRAHLGARLAAWARPVPSVLPGGVLPSRPTNHSFVEMLFRDLVEDSIDGCQSHLDTISAQIVPRVTRASTIAVLTASLDEYIELNLRSLADVQAVQRYARFSLSTTVRGVCRVSHASLQAQLDAWAKRTTADIYRGVSRSIVACADAVIARCKSFFVLGPPTTYSETREATLALREMVSASDWVRDQTAWLDRLKDFLDEHRWTQADDEFSRLLDAHRTRDEFFDFLATRSRDISNAAARLTTELSGEIDAFMAHWKALDASADQMFMRPVRNPVLMSDSIATHGPQALLQMHQLAIPQSQTHVEPGHSRRSSVVPYHSLDVISGSTDDIMREFQALSNLEISHDSDAVASRTRLGGVSQIPNIRRNGTDLEPTAESGIQSSKSSRPPEVMPTPVRHVSDADVHSIAPDITVAVDNDDGLPTPGRRSSISGRARTPRSMSMQGTDLTDGGRRRSIGSSCSRSGSVSVESSATAQQLRNSQARRVSLRAGHAASQSVTGRLSVTHHRSTHSPLGDLEEIADAPAALTQMQSKIADAASVAQAIRAKIECLENVQGMPEIEAVMEKMASRRLLIGSLLRMRERLAHWRSQPVALLDMQEIATTSAELSRVVEDSPLVNSPIVKLTHEDLRMFTLVESPLLAKLKNPIFQDDHWVLIRQVLQFDFESGRNCLDDIAARLGRSSLAVVSARIDPIETAAGKEHAITNVIKEINERYYSMPIELESNNRFGLTVVKSFSNYISTIESDLLTVGMMISSKGMEKYIAQLRETEARLQAAAVAMREWEQMQPLMINVHGFFESEEVRLQLSVELRRFRVFETGYRVIIANVQKCELFSALIELHPDLPASVADIRNGLRRVIDDVQGWLDNKRLVFPRLFFVSDDELLELVSIAKEPSTVQHQLPRYFCFSELIYTNDADRDYVVTGVRSPEGEAVQFANPIPTRGLGVEQWLAKVEAESQATLRKLLVSRMAQLKFEEVHQSWKVIYEKMVRSTPIQIAQVAFQTLRTAELQACIEDDTAPSISEFVGRSRDNIGRLAALIRQGDSSAAVVNCWKSLIAIELNYRDWGQELHDKRVHDATAFEWLRGLRYYFSEESEGVTVRQYLQHSVYGYEYLGAGARLCWSNVSEKCHAAAWSALELKMGVTAYGPVSVGKTEIFKDFARALGRFAVFFNCSQGVSPHVLTRLMTGMAMTGCYLLMTNLDKLDESALGTVWQAITTLRDLSERKDATSVSYLGRIIKLQPATSVCFFATVSPGSLARPDFVASLRAQTRLVALAAPDIASIASALLHMAAFGDAHELACKIAALFTMAGDQLSRQAHYDFSLRTTRIVIRLAEMARNQGGALLLYVAGIVPDETNAVLYAIHSYIRPKLLFDDLPIFANLVCIVFGVADRTDAEAAADAEMVASASASLAEKVAAIRPASMQQLVSRTIGQFEQIVEHGQHTIVLGKMSVGKSSLIRSVAALLGTQIHVVNPRALPPSFLFGFEESTGYQRGVIESIVDAAQRTTKRHWLVFDSPLEAAWADSVSSMLQKDEGGALCLSNGKRVVLGGNVLVAIETDNLDNASAGFVGRFNVVFVRNEWSWRVRLQSWLGEFERRWIDRGNEVTQFATMQIQIEGCFSSFMESIIVFVEDCGIKASIPVVFNGVLDILECLLMEHGRAAASRSKSARPFSHMTIVDVIEDMFHYAIIWSFGASIGTEHRAAFQSIFSRLIKVSRSSSRLASVLADRIDISVFDLKLDPVSATWFNMLDALSGAGLLSSRVLARQREVISLLLRHEKHVMLIGEIGSRKTSVATDIMLDLCTQDRYNTIGHAVPLLPASDVSELTAHFHKVLVADDSASASEHDMYVPVNSSSLLIFVDDLHLPSPNAEGSRTMWEFLRFFVDQGAYWCTPQTLRRVRKVGIFALCDLLRNSVVVAPPRLMRHFALVFFNETDVFEDATMVHFYRRVEEFMAFSNAENVQSRMYSAVNSTLDMLHLLKRRLVLSSHGPFYIFSSHDLEKVFEGFLRVAPSCFAGNESLFTLWLHETRRVFEDRIKYGDLNIFEDCLRQIARKYFHMDDTSEQALFSDASVERDAVQHEGSVGTPVLTRHEMDVVDDEHLNELIRAVRAKMPNVADTFSDDITVFPDCAAHFARLDRVFAAERHLHAVLVCRPGLDISLDVVRMVTTARNLPLREISFRGEVGLESWRAFIRKHVTEAGLAEKRVAVCITLMPGVHVPAEVWGDLHAVYDGARSRHLWPPKEYEDLMTKISHQFRMRRDVATSARSDFSQSFQREIFADGSGRQPNPLEITRYWAQRVQENVCIILRVDATDVATHQSMLRFPRTISRSTVDIYREYSENDLLQLSYRTFMLVFEETKSFADEIEMLSHLVVKIYLNSRETIRDPARRRRSLSTIEFAKYILWFSRHAAAQDSNLRQQIAEFTTCLRRTRRLKDRIERLVEEGRQELVELPLQLERISNELSGLKIAIETNEQEMVRLTNIMRERRETALRVMVEREATIANAGLTEAKSAFEEAIERLHAIKKNDLEELKTFVIPPPLLALVADGLCILFDKPGGWGEARKLLSSHTFLQRITQFDYTLISDSKLEKLRKIVDYPGFQIDKSAKVGTAVKALCMWLRNMSRYCRETRSRLQTDSALADAKMVFSRMVSETVDNHVEEQELEQLRQFSGAMREREASLLLQKRELSGRMTLIKEIFAPESIFNHASSDHVTESQWIQQAFHSEDGGVVFTDPDVFKAHAEYQLELSKLATIKQGMSKDLSDSAASLEDIRAAIESITLPFIIELMELKDGGSFTGAAKSTLLKLLKLPAHSHPDALKTVDIPSLANSNATLIKNTSENPLFQRVAFYDSKMVFSTAISPFQACRGAFIVRDIVVSLHGYYSKKERIGNIVEESQKEVNIKKAQFDQVWSGIYSHLPEYWTFEVIIEKYKQIHKKLLDCSPADVIPHIPSLVKNPLLGMLLDASCKIVSWGGGIDEFERRLSDDPFSFSAAAGQVKIGDESNQRLITDENPVSIESVVSQVEEEMHRVYVDIIGLLPRPLSFRILISMGLKRLCELARVSRRWCELAKQQQIWKWLSHENGWGVAFTYPKSLDWRDFYSRLHVLRKERVPEAISRFDEEMEGLSGLKAHKRAAAFMKKLPEYLRLDRNESEISKRVGELIFLELSNDIFMALEAHFTEELFMQESLAASSPTTPLSQYKQSMQKNSSLRFKKAIICVKSVSGHNFGTKFMHELVVEKASKLHILHPSIERVKKHINRIDTALTIECASIPFVTDHAHALGPPKIPKRVLPESFSMFRTIAEYLNIVHAYYRGLQMGKHVQFQVRFIKALKTLCNKIETQISELKKQHSTLRGDSLLLASAHAFLPSMTNDERNEASAKWVTSIGEHHLMRDRREVFSAHFPKLKEFWTVTETEQMLTNAMLLRNTTSDMLLIDSSGMAQVLLDELSEFVCGATVIDALDEELPAKLKQHVKTAGLVLIKNVGVDPDIHGEIVRFRAARHAAARELPNLVGRADAKILVCTTFDILFDMEPPFSRLYFEYTDESMRAVLLDSLLSFSKPAFHAQRIDIRRRLETQTDILNEWFSALIEFTKTRQSVEEELVHDIILFQSRNAETHELRRRREEFEVDVAPLYVPFNKVIGYAMDIWSVMRRLVLVNPTYCFSARILVDCFKQSISEHLRLSGSGHLERREIEAIVDDLTIRTANALGRALAQADRVPLFAAIAMVRMRYYGIIAKKDDQIISTLIQKRCELGDPFEFSKWLHTKFLQTLEDRSTFVQVLEGLMATERRPTTLASGPLADIFERRMTPFQRLLVQIMALPQFVDESMREVLQDLGVWTNDARMPARYLDVAQDSSFSMVLLLSVSPREAVRGIVALSETYEESHLQLSIVNEADKQGDRWIQKIKFAAENDAWVLIVIDSFWIGLLDKIHQLSKMPSSGFKIWIVGMTSLSYRLPLWLFSDAHCICDEEDLDSWLVLHKLQRNEAHIDELFRPWLATLLKFHFGLVSLMRRSETAFPDFMSFDDIDLKLSLRAYATAIRRKLPLETLKRVLLDAIYAPEARSPQDYERLASLWSEAVRTFDASVAANGMPLEKMSRDNFVSFLAQSRPFMFTPKNLRVHRSGNAVDIDAISLDLCRKLALILDAIQPAAAQLASDRMIKHKIGQYLNTLPTTINLRLIYENMNSPESHQTKCFLLEEANNFLRLLRRVRMNLRVLLTSFSNGYPTASARKTLDAVTNNKVLQSWVRRAHPTSATLDMWMDDIGRRIKFLDKWIMLGQPWLIHAGLPFSLRALLQGLRQIFASKAQAGISTVELIFEQIDLAELDRRKIADLSARYGIAAVLAGFHMEGVRMVDGKVEALDAGKPDSLPLFMVRPQYLKDPAPYRGSLIPVSTHLLDSDGGRGFSGTSSKRPLLKPAPPSTPERAAAPAPPKPPVYEVGCMACVSEEKGGTTELLEDGSRQNQICSLKVQSCVAPELLHHQGCQMLVDVSGKTTPEYLRRGYVDLNYMHSLNSMSDSLDRNISEASHHFTVYVCSSSDAENERRFLFQHVFPGLLNDMAYRHIDLHFVDLKYNPAGGGTEAVAVDPASHLQAALTNIKRAALFVGIFGSKLGPLLHRRDLPPHIFAAHTPLTSLIEKPKTMAELEVEYALTQDDNRYIHKGLRSCMFYFRDPNFARSVPKSFRAQYEPEDVEEKVRLDQLRMSMLRRFPDRCVPHYPGYFTRVVGREVQMGGLEKLGERVRNDLIMAILEFVKQRRRGSSGAALGSQDSDSFSGRESITRPIIEAVCSSGTPFVQEKRSTLSSAILIYGASGMGKTALLSHLCHEFPKRDVVVLYNFVRSWAGSFNVDSMIQRFCIKLFAQLRIQSHRLPTESVKLKEYFVALLNEVVFYGNKVAVIIDGIDRMVNSQGQRDDLWWLPPPSELGSEVCSSISWIMSAADDQIMPRLQSKYKDATKIPLLALTDDDKRKIIADRGKALRLRVDARSVNYLLDQKASESPLYLRVVLKEAQQSMSNGHFVFEDYHLETTWLVFEQVFERIERKHGVEIIRLFFSLLSFARNGLREMELVGLLKLDLAAWNLLFESIEDYIIKTSTGYVIVFHEQFTAAIRRRYLRLPSESERFHHLLASYYISICDPAGDLSWLGNNEIRAADISFHQLRAKRPISEIARIMCSIGYVSAVFTSNLAHELPGYFSEAVKLAVDSENSADRSRLTDYSFFVERYSHNLATYPKLAYSLALSLPNGFCMYVREEALESYKKQATREPFLNCLSLAEDQLEMVPLGAHMTEIIYVGVIVVGALGKCCVSVSSDATVKCWNIDTFLFVKTLLAASIGADSATECCFSLNHSELVAFGTRNSHICVFTTETGMPFSRIENVYTGGPLFFSEDAGGVWQRGPHKSLQFVHFASGRTLDATGNAMDDANGVITGNGLPPRASTALMPAIKGGKVASVVARSMDGHKIALLTIDKRRHIAVLSAKTMREICRFVEDGASDASRGQFSIGKDLLAVVLAGGDIMIWKIDTHSRVALVRMPSDIKVSCISVSIDESMLYFGSTSSTLGVASTKSGHIFKRLWIGEKTVLSQMCIATSKGKERFFLAAGTRLSTCDSHSSLRMETGGTQKQHVELSIPLRHSAPINAVLPFSKRQQNGVEAISVSRDGRLVSWAVSDSLKKLAPVHEVFVAEDLTSCRLSQTTGFAVVTAGTSAIIWNVHEAEEVLRISHKHALRDAILVKNRIDDTGLTLYTWMIDGQLSAWKIMGRASMFLTYDPTPLFQRFITVLPSRPQMSSRREFLVANDFTVIVLDSETGQELRRFETRGHETVLGLSWHHMPGEVPRVMYVTKTTLFVDGEIWSYGGSLGDMMQLDSCKRDRTGTYVGYSGVQLGESFVGKTSLEKRIIGVVVVLAASAGQRRHRVCMLKHDNARVVQWDFLHDPSFIVTIATDLMVRVWDIRGPPHAIRAMSASDIGRPIDIWTHAGLDGAASSENARDTARDSEEQGGAELKGDGTEDRDQRAKSAQLGSTVSYRRRLTIAQQALMIGTQIDGIVGHVCAMFPLRSPCTCLQVANDDYVLYTGNEQGDVLQFRLEFAMTDDLQRRPSRK